MPLPWTVPPLDRPPNDNSNSSLFDFPCICSTSLQRAIFVRHSEASPCPHIAWSSEKPKSNGLMSVSWLRIRLKSIWMINPERPEHVCPEVCMSSLRRKNTLRSADLSGVSTIGRFVWSKQTRHPSIRPFFSASCLHRVRHFSQFAGVHFVSSLRSILSLVTASLWHDVRVNIHLGSATTVTCSIHVLDTSTARSSRSSSRRWPGRPSHSCRAGRPHTMLKSMPRVY